MKIGIVGAGNIGATLARTRTSATPGIKMPIPLSGENEVKGSQLRNTIANLLLLE